MRLQASVEGVCIDDGAKFGQMRAHKITKDLARC